MFMRLRQPLFLSPEVIQLNATLYNWYRLRIYRLIIIGYRLMITDFKYDFIWSPK